MMATTAPLPPPPNDPDIEIKVKKGLERVSENIHISANEPSLAVYRLQEHIRRALPPTVTRRHHVTQLHTNLQGTCYDVEYAVSAVHGMKEASASFTSLQELLKSAIFHRQQLKYEQTRRLVTRLDCGGHVAHYVPRWSNHFATLHCSVFFLTILLINLLWIKIIKYPLFQ